MLSGDFPGCLVDGYIHWLNLSTQELEFRPAASPWASASSNWRLIIQKPGSYPRAILQKPNPASHLTRLIDTRSSTFSVVSGLLSPLESSEHIIATHTAQTLEISLPRFCLSFFVNTNWELECRSMPGYVIDETQACGTLFGLRNKLTLCLSASRSEIHLLSRRIIIPQGDISFEIRGDFAHVSIDTRYQQRVHWHEYTIDKDLGCLTSNASLSSKLYQCYLHALTSHVLPDPLSSHTGTEEALYILRNAACRSFQALGSHEASMLGRISELSPHRRHVKSTKTQGVWMATVTWQDLPALSQHDDFFWAVRSLLDHARALVTLHGLPAIVDVPTSDPRLRNRAASRNKSYYPSDLHMSGLSSPVDDVEYKSRDVINCISGELSSFRTSWSLWNVQPSLDDMLPGLWRLMESLELLETAGSGISPRYSREWFSLMALSNWFSLYNLCRMVTNPSRKNLRIQLSFSLSAAAYIHPEFSYIVAVIMILALDGRCRHLSPPPQRFYRVSDGLNPEITRLKQIISGCWLRFEYANIKRESLVVAESILRQWPNYQSVDFREQWFNKLACKHHIKIYVLSISRNIQLNEYILQLQSILRDYGNVTRPSRDSYVFSPQFITGGSKPPSYSLHDVLISHSNFPVPSPDGERFQDHAVTPSVATKVIRPQAESRDLKVLIEELQLSQQPLLQLYGAELDKSHRELLARNAPKCLPVGGTVPLHEVFLKYHNECSRKKDKLFSEIMAALAPSQILEETWSLAGIWPRITFQSILRQLGHDRINTIPKQWKLVFMCYAVTFVKYQQSLRMLELSSRQNHDELLREIEAIRHNTLAESTPDWLLIQVRLLLC
jgi:hypothetical protein